MNTAKPRSGSSGDGPAISRRKSIRVTPPRELRCTVIGLGARVSVLDISVGGIALRTGRAILRGAMPHLTLHLDNIKIAAQARVIHCERDDGQWRIGLAFVTDAALAESIEHLL